MVRQMRALKRFKVIGDLLPLEYRNFVPIFEAKVTIAIKKTIQTVAIELRGCSCVATKAFEQCQPIGHDIFARLHFATLKKLTEPARHLVNFKDCSSLHYH